MDLEQRQKLYKKIEDYRGRPLIVYATSTRPGAPGKMASDAVREFLDQIDAIANHDARSVDILLHSNGGDALVAWKLMSTLRQHFDNIAVIVPYMAMSAATLFALGADDIYMHRNAALGPIDPQITVTFGDGTTRNFSYEDVGAFLRFLSDEVQITEQPQITAIVEKLFSAVDPISVGSAKRASELSASIGERLLLTHMKNEEDRGRAKEIAENLNKSFFAHGDTVSRRRAVELNLKIMDEDSRFDALIWRAYVALEEYMEMRTVHHPLQHYLKDKTAAKSLEPAQPLPIPPNAPPQVVQQIWQSAVQNVLSRLSRPGREVGFSLVSGVIESIRLASEFCSHGTVSAYRLPDGQVQTSVTTLGSGWKKAVS